ncbi:Cyclic nucleotide-binding protein [Pseudocohnilembus persalinus]|uniref:Cyclic nucleotide-binding protein n=1 Tax=Pseudocohnilembus persalinus TaxID=266149 RepID=A0A0V0R1H7_PSEPJ|nr:Cyclic nucleotide-binding protein [Pseudocohnilembus persalinus]|eukprot:KRX08008.1 Cyclic nucleotide-binding protein [Pseudocohnilembus persalinus]
MEKDPVWHEGSFQVQIMIQLFVDIIKGFSTGYVEQGNIILDHYRVAISIAMYQIKIQHKDNTWLHNANLIEENYWRRYIESLFVACSSMITVLVYSPKNEIEVIFVTFTMVFNCGVFAYSINTHLQVRMKDYLQYLHKEKVQLAIEDVDTLMSKFSTNLQQEIKQEVYSTKIDDFKVIKENFSDGVVKNLYKIIKEIMLGPGEDLFQDENLEFQDQDRSIYLLEKGLIQLYLQKDELETNISQISPGQLLGEISFFTGQARNSKAKSIGFSNLLRIPRDQFINLIKEYGNNLDFERFCFIKDQIIFSKNYWMIDIPCKTCKKYGHLSMDYYPQKLLKQDLEQIGQQQSNYGKQQQQLSQKQFDQDQRFIVVLKL